MPNGLFYLNALNKSILYIRGVWLVFNMFCRNSELNANSADPDQTPRSAASDLGLCCLPVSLLWDARHKWVNHETNIIWCSQKKKRKRKNKYFMVFTEDKTKEHFYYYYFILLMLYLSRNGSSLHSIRILVPENRYLWSHYENTPIQIHCKFYR